MPDRSSALPAPERSTTVPRTNGSRARGWLLWVSCASVTSSGVAYAWMRYMMEASDSFSAYNHPAQPWALRVHVLLAPVLVFALGWLWAAHVLPKLRGTPPAAPSRSSGIVLIGLGALMTLSGYLLQVLSGEGLRVAAAWTHGISGGVFFLLLAAHTLAALRR